MRLAIRISLVISALFYFSIGFFGYLLFGDSINADMLVNFDQLAHGTTIGFIINATVRLSYAIHLMLVFPLINFCLRANINELFLPYKTNLANDTPRDIHGISSVWDKMVAAMFILVSLFASGIAIWTNLSPPAGSKT
ncbi:Amino acid transporter AVT6C [Bienertia sinuspersici]